MFDELALVSGVLIKYAVMLFLIFFSIALLHSFLTKLRNEPAMLAKLIFVTFVPPTLAIGVPYFFLYKQLELSLWLNVIASFAIYAFATDFLEKRVNVRFKDK